MRPGSQFVLRAAARLHTPIIALFAFSLFVARPAGAGIGLIAGLALALALALNVLVFGAVAARKAAPGQAARAMLAFGLIGAIIGAGAPRLAYAHQLVEAGLFLATLGAASLTFAVLVGRAPTLRDEDI